MASQSSTGSPKPGRRTTPSAKQTGESLNDKKSPRNILKIGASKSSTPVPSNIASRGNSNLGSNTVKKDIDHFKSESVTDVENILARLRMNDSRKPVQAKTEQDHLDKVIANLNEQNKILRKQQMELQEDSETGSYKDPDRSSSSDLFTPATETFDISVHGNQGNYLGVRNAAEMARIKQELEAAKSLISRQELELAETRNLRHTMEQAMGTASEGEHPMQYEVSRFQSDQAQSAFDASARPFTSSRLESAWPTLDESKTDFAGTLVNPGMSRARNWGPQLSIATGVGAAPQPIPYSNNRMNTQAFGAAQGLTTTQAEMNMPRNRTFSSGSSNMGYGIEERLLPGMVPGHAGSRRDNQIRSHSTMSDPLSPTTPMSMYGQTFVDPLALSTLAGVGQYPYNDRYLTSQTSPIAGQFSASLGNVFANDPQIAGTGFGGQNYIMPAEPMNYRRLLDKSVSCDWKYIVDKIVCSNDQQASIFLQQKLKLGTVEQKYEIVESIVNQAYPLMINRFGNFLVQRCFEHGTPDQVIAIANAIHGSVISLSMDPFGCHVIQKAFDSVPEDHKADMVRELLRRIPDTVIHRYACHVWQKLFELRWSGEPPQIMVKVNEALQGMWHEVALGETGSLVVQNIFENCVEEEKRPAVEEVISSIDLIAHGQFGNWCIQHLCEHGSPPDKRRVIDHILNNAYNFSIDQFASKVVEKCLKIGGPEFLERYLSVITTTRPDRPRIPLIDIAGDQYGNYLVQWILTYSLQHQKEQVAIHIRKHMVSLRGSKFGSRVAMLCSNPASLTRPGAGTGLVNPYGPPQQRLGNNRYR